MLRTAHLVALLVLISGCGAGSTSVNRESATKAYRAGLADFEQRNYQSASVNLTIAIGSGYLNPDLTIEALAKHAVANAALGNFDAANADLERMKNAPDQSLFWAATAFVLTKQGNTTEATAALQQAKRLNPSLEPFK